MTHAVETKQRIAALQDWLRAETLDGVFVPHSDFWQGEELMPCDQRLRWLTGFTGSAGFALIVQDAAALFVDGRYTLQAPEETAGSGIEVRHFLEAPWQTWDRLPPNPKLAVDPMLVTGAWAERAQKLLVAKGGTLQFTQDNPVDKIWTDRPGAAFTPVELYPEALAGESCANKRQRLAKLLQEQTLTAALITDPTAIAWLLNIRAQDYPHTPVALSVALLRADASLIWFTVPQRESAELRAHLGEGCTVQSPATWGEVFATLSGQTVAVDEATAALWLEQKLQAAGAILKRQACIAALPKACKTVAELDGMRAAHRRDGVALAGFLGWYAGAVANGTSSLCESDLIAQLEQARASANEYRGASFDTICGVGAHGAIVHYHTTDASDCAVAGNTLLLLDSGGQYIDGTTDITRTLPVGQPGEEQRRAYTLVLQGHIALSAARFPEGTTGAQLDALARAPLWRAGLNYDHGTGHGVGHYLSVHEGPQSISTRANTVALQTGMVLSNEPGYYKSGAYGIRIENLIAVVESKPGDSGKPFLEFETLTLAPYERSLIMTDLLTNEERDWINAYHARVWRELGPQLTGKARDWLEAACMPLAS